MFVNKFATLVLCCLVLIIVLIFTGQFLSSKSFTIYVVRTNAQNDSKPRIPSLEEMETPSVHSGPSSGVKVAANHINCRPMFDIGWGSNGGHGASSPGVGEPLGDDLRSLKRKKRRNTQLTEDYFPFVQALPDMTKGSGKLVAFQTETRLKQLNGQLPYIPCRINLYEEEDIRQCMSSRGNSFHPFWVAFVGDSKMRDRFHYMAYATDKVFNWSFTESGSKYSKMRLQEFDEQIKTNLYADCEANGVNGARLTYICSRIGIPDDNLVQWANAPSNAIIPDVLILEFGAWIATTFQSPDLRAQDESLLAWFKLKPLLARIAQKTLVLAAAHSRLRTAPDILYKLHPRPFPKLKLKYYLLVDSEIEMMDMAMAAAIGGSNVVLWDSSLPMNLASRTDCEKARDLRLWTSWDKEKTNWKGTTRFRCLDDIHRNSITLQDEITMVLNYLCNRFVPRFSNNTSCCS